MYDEYWKLQAELYFNSCEYPDDYYEWDWYEDNIGYYFVVSMRAQRIHHRERMIAKGRNIELQRDWYWSQDPHRLERAEMFARYNYNHLAVCSCDGCGNQRHNSWSKGQDRLTMQERRAGIRAKHRKKFEKELNIC